MPSPLMLPFMQWARGLRFPAKFWLLGALGGSLLCAVGFDSAFTHGRRTLLRLLAGFAAGFTLLLAGSIAAPDRGARHLAYPRPP